MIPTTLVAAAASLLGAGGSAPGAAAARDGGAPGSFDHFSELVLYATIDIGIVTVSIGLVLCIWRLVRGPTLVDRAVASDTLALQVVGLVVLLTVSLSSLVDFDAVLIVAILGFVSTVAFAQFIGRRGAVT